MSEWHSKHVEFYHQIKSIKTCISLVLIWSLYTKMHGPMNIKKKECFIVIAFECTVRNGRVNQKGLKLNGTHQLLVCADDVHWLSKCIHTMKNIEALLVASKEIGLELNTVKTYSCFINRMKGESQHGNSWSVLCNVLKFKFRECVLPLNPESFIILIVV